MNVENNVFNKSHFKFCITNEINILLKNVVELTTAIFRNCTNNSIILQSINQQKNITLKRYTKKINFLLKIKFSNFKAQSIYLINKILLFKNQIAIINELNIIAKRYYFAYFFNVIINEFVKYVFSNMRYTHFNYKNIKFKIVACYKL